MDSDRERLFRSWWDDHRAIFHKVARSFAPTPADEPDLLQEMLIQLWRSMPAFRGHCQPTTWIYRVCFNTALGWKRGETRRTKLLISQDEPPDPSCPAPQPDARQEHTERLEALYAAVRSLPVQDRSLVLMLLDGLSYREISGVTGLSENHVGVSLTRARGKLMKLLEGKRDEL